MVACDAVEDLRVPVVEHGREVVEKDYGHATSFSQLTIRNPGVLHLDRPGGGVLKCVTHGHCLSLAWEAFAGRPPPGLNL